MKDAPEYLNIPDYAARIGVSRMTAYRYVRDGKIPVLNLSGRMVVPVKPDQQAA